MSGEDTRHLSRFTCQRASAARERAAVRTSYTTMPGLSTFLSADPPPLLVEMSGLEPPTSAVQGPRSPN